MLNSFFLAPIAAMYHLVVLIRHKLFDWNILKSKEFDIPIIVVGNLTVGGTGKTPVTEFLIESLALNYKIAVLSRGYKRKTKGFLLATENSSYKQIGDEPKQIKIKYPDVHVAVCEKRVDGIQKLRELFPDINLIILDDAFQHRYVEPWINIVLMDYNRPVYKDKFLPLGRLRDNVGQLDRANFVLVTKCPEAIKPLDLRIVYKSLNLFPYQKLYFSRMVHDEVSPLYPNIVKRRVAQGDNIIAMAGVGNPETFLKSMYQKYKVISEVIFEDHHTYRIKDLDRLMEIIQQSPKDTIIITTEKDAVKLTNGSRIPEEIQKRLFYVPMRVELLGDSNKDFLRQIELYVRSNQKYSFLHPE